MENLKFGFQIGIALERNCSIRFYSESCPQVFSVVVYFDEKSGWAKKQEEEAAKKKNDGKAIAKERAARPKTRRRERLRSGKPAEQVATAERTAAKVASESEDRTCNTFSQGEEAYHYYVFGVKC